MNDPRTGHGPSGAKLLNESKANPSSVNMDIFARRSGGRGGAGQGPTGQGTVNDRYLQETREQNPDPAEAKQDEAKVSLAKCRFVTPLEELKLNEPFEFAVDVKRIGEPKSIAATFDLYCSRKRDGKVERDRIWAGKGGKPVDAKADPIVLQGKDILATQADYVLGETVTFELEATHPEADQPAKSDPVEVGLKVKAQWIGGDDLHFRTDGEFPLLGADGSLLQVLATAVGRIQKPAQSGETCVCFGFASSAGDADANRSLSLRRAQVVRALLDRDEAAWGDLAKANFETRDIQQFLSDLHAACGWECDPGEVDGIDGSKTKAAIEAFQAECNSRYKLGLKEDGVCGPRTWSAVQRAILGQVQGVLSDDVSQAPSWPKAKWGAGGDGVYGNGEDFATGGDKPEERSVQITFFTPGGEPALAKAPSGQKSTTQENPVQDKTKVAKEKVSSRRGKPKNSSPSIPEVAYRYPFPSGLKSLPGVRLVVVPHRVEQPFLGAWGQIIAVNGDVTKAPSEYASGNDAPTFAATVGKADGRFMFKDIAWTLGIVFRIVSEVSSAWKTSWTAEQRELTNEPPGFTLEQRIQRAFAHEKDHYQCYEAYWRFMNHYIDEYSRKTFETPEECSQAISLVKKNIEINFTATRLRSSNFDLIPLEGGQYGDPRLRKDLDLRWYGTKEEARSGEGRMSIILHDIASVSSNPFANQEARDGVVYDPNSNGRSR